MHLCICLVFMSKYTPEHSDCVRLILASFILTNHSYVVYHDLCVLVLIFNVAY
jgi:hypothetical protein